MVVYTSAKCGHCGASWANLSPNAQLTSFDTIGPPIIRCMYCSKDNVTEWKLPRDLNPIQKLIHINAKQVLGIILSFGFMGIGYGAFSEIYDPKTDNIILTLIFSLPFVFVGIKGLWNNLNQKSDLKYLEDKFDKNGGFIWSYEVYS